MYLSARRVIFSVNGLATEVCASLDAGYWDSDGEVGSVGGGAFLVNSRATPPEKMCGAFCRGEGSFLVNSRATPPEKNVRYFVAEEEEDQALLGEITFRGH